MYQPEKFITIAMEQLYSHSYCLIDRDLKTLIRQVKKEIFNHEYYGKYKLLEKEEGMYIKLILVGKNSYSY